jgi:hypothetical protein
MNYEQRLSFLGYTPNEVCETAERAAIYEYDAGMSRAAAEEKALAGLRDRRNKEEAGR